MVKSNTNRESNKMIIYYRADGTHFCIPLGAGRPSVRVRDVPGKFARALVARQLGHVNFELRAA